MDPVEAPAFPFMISAEAHAELAALVGELDAAMGDLGRTLTGILDVLGGQAAAAYAETEPEDFGGAEDAAV